MSIFHVEGGGGGSCPNPSIFSMEMVNDVYLRDGLRYCIQV